jgi:hypothetical protein
VVAKDGNIIKAAVKALISGMNQQTKDVITQDVALN